MELKQFITQTLNDIIDGIADSQKHASERQAVINPHFESSVARCFYVQDDNSSYDAFEVQNIEFDIAVTVSNEDKSKAGIGVLSAVLNVGAQGEENQSSNEVSRVKFTVPVVFPIKRTEFVKKEQW